MTSLIDYTQIRPFLSDRVVESMGEPTLIDGLPPMWTLGGLRIFVSLEIVGEEVWLQVSYSHRKTIPSHLQTVRIREGMFRTGSVVVAVFPPVDEYINHHPRCLHLWERVTGPRLIPDLRGEMDGIVSI